MYKHKLSLAISSSSKLIVLGFLMCFLSSIFPLASLGQGLPTRQADFLPQEILDIDMGISSAWLLEKIKNSGTHSSTPLARPNRIKITWVPKNNPYYEQLEFMFTEQNRLYLISVAVNDESRWNVNALKKQFLDKFQVSADRPARFRIGDKDTIIYPPESGGKSHFFEVTQVSSGKKSLELFAKDIDKEDRPPAEPANGGGAKQEEKAPMQ